jgi:biotin transporter BioY
VILAGGLAQLTALTGSTSAAMAAGVHPFLALDFVKAVAAALASPRRGGRASA